MIDGCDDAIILWETPKIDRSTPIVAQTDPRLVHLYLDQSTAKRKRYLFARAAA